MMRSQDAPIVDGFFGREIGDENAVGAGGRCRGSEFFQAHLKNRIVVAEQDERNLRRLANATHQFENARQRGAGF